jgi:hypothetical protein
VKLIAIFKTLDANDEQALLSGGFHFGLSARREYALRI